MSTKAGVVGSGPNGLAAAIVLAQAGLDVEVRESTLQFGGATRSGELTLPGFVHDLGSAVHPMAVSSPFFSRLGLEQHGLHWIWPPIELAHPFDDGTAVLVERDVSATAAQFGGDASSYRRLLIPVAKNWSTLFDEVFRPLRLPRHPFLMARFGAAALAPLSVIARTLFRDDRPRALLAGFAAHSTLKMETPMSAGFALIMAGSAHAVGWPFPRSGAHAIAKSLVSVLEKLGGRVRTGERVKDIGEFGNCELLLCDVSPQQFLHMTPRRLPRPFRRLLQSYRYGPGVFKVDWALREPIPWKAKDCLRSATVHLGGSFDEVCASERATWEGRPPERPFVLLTQPSLFDSSRAPAGRHTAWAYCHVPNGWRGSALKAIEDQVERFAPGFRECVLARATHSTEQMESWNENLVGGDVSGGVPDLVQFALRPTWRRYRTPLPGVYLCSSSTPPGGAVHGMCGYFAARWALSDRCP